MDCSICCEEYNKGNRKKTTCPFCTFDCCVACQKRFLIDLPNDPHCMSCKRGYLRGHLKSLVSKTFIDKDYKCHRENILYEREKCMLPGTQEALEIDAQREEITKALKDVMEQKNKIHAKIFKLSFTSSVSDTGYLRQVRTVMTPEQSNEVRKLYEKLPNISVTIRNLKEQRVNLAFAHLGREQIGEQERRQFVKKCPGDDCNGFLSNHWKCSLCGIKVCHKCHEIKTEAEEHECNPENVQTAELIAKETKPCPSCGTRIFKISGCRQMWCVHCHVAFDWNTLKIATGLIHNPHYYEYQRSINGGVAPRVPGDVPGGCEDIPHLWSCNRYWTAMQLKTDLLIKLQGAHRLLVHIHDEEIPRLPNEYVAQDNLDIRKKFLKNDINESKFRWLLQRREKNRNKGKELRQLYDMFVTCGTDLIRRTMNPYAKVEDIETICKEFVTLGEYFSENTKNVGVSYGGVIPVVTFNRDHRLWCTLETINKKIKNKKEKTQQVSNPCMQLELQQLRDI